MKLLWFLCSLLAFRATDCCKLDQKFETYQRTFNERLKKLVNKRRQLEQALKKAAVINETKDMINVLKEHCEVFRTTWDTLQQTKTASEAAPDDITKKEAMSDARAKFDQANAQFKETLGIRPWSLFTLDNILLVLGLLTGGLAIFFFVRRGLGVSVYITGAISIIVLCFALGIFALKEPNWKDIEI